MLVTTRKLNRKNFKPKTIDYESEIVFQRNFQLEAWSQVRNFTCKTGNKSVTKKICIDKNISTKTLSADFKPVISDYY